MNNGGYTYLCLICGLPYVAGVASTLIVLARISRYGRWGLLPFGGTFKHWWEDHHD